MIIRLVCSSILATASVSAAPGPWDRFFNKPAISASQGIASAMNNAVASAFNPLSVKAANPPVFPQLSEGPAVAAAQKAGACSMPLREYRAEPQFFIGSTRRQSSKVDVGIIRQAPAPPCQ